MIKFQRDYRKICGNPYYNFYTGEASGLNFGALDS